MTHITHLFFILFPVFILLITCFLVINEADTKAIGRRQEKRRAVRCWVMSLMGIGMAAPFIVVSLIAFT